MIPPAPRDMPEHMHSPLSSIPAPVRAILDLFDDALADVRFPELDREVLAEHRRRLEAAQERVVQQQAELEAARTELEACRKELTNLARRAQRYALVYAEENESLRERLQAIAFETKPPRKARKPRRRSEKASPQLALAKDPAAG